VDCVTFDRTRAVRRAAHAALLASIAAAAGVLAGPARASLTDEIQVYLDDIDDPGRFGLEVHVNGTPSGVGEPSYPGEVTNDHGVRVTPEFSYGLAPGLEAGAYLPVVHAPSDTLSLAGAKLRLKWLPVRQAGGGDGIFAGVNGELSDVAQRFVQSRRGFELRPILGARGGPWVAAVNPVLDFALGEPGRSQPPTFAPSFKVSRDLVPGVATGFEYYAVLGPLSDVPAWPAQQHALYWAWDIDRKPWVVNLGLGRGLTAATDRWTVKMIFEVPLEP
jgi:hypothetical protein